MARGWGGANDDNWQPQLAKYVELFVIKRYEHLSKEEGEVFASLKIGRMPMDKSWHCGRGRPPSSSSPRQAQSVPPWPPRPCSSPLFFSSSHSSPPPPSLHYHPRQDQAQPLPWETARCTRCVSATKTVTRTRSASNTCATHGRWPHHIFFIGPRSDHSLLMSVTHWLTHSLTTLLKIEWIDLSVQTLQTM